MRISVPVFSSIYPDKVLFRVSPQRAVKMVEDGKAYLINDNTAIRLVDLARSSERSQNSLTAFDAEVAAGEFGDSKTAKLGWKRKRLLEELGKQVEDAIERSQMKLKIWKQTKDTKAVLV